MPETKTSRSKKTPLSSLISKNKEEVGSVAKTPEITNTEHEFLKENLEEPAIRLPEKEPVELQSEPEVEDKPVLPPVVKTTQLKPTLEGINSPVVKVWPEAGKTSSAGLTDAEQKLISDPPVSFQPAQKKIFDKPPALKAAAKPSRAGVWLFVISLVALAGLCSYFYSQGFRLVLENVEEKEPSAELETYQPVRETESDPLRNPAVAPVTEGTGTASSSVASSAPSSAPILINQIKITSTPTGFLNARKSGSLSAAIVGKVYPGEVYHFLQESGGWYKIALKDGTPAWVIATYTEKLPNP